MLGPVADMYVSSEEGRGLDLAWRQQRLDLAVPIGLENLQVFL